MISVCYHQITVCPAIIDYIYFNAFRNAAKQHMSSLELSLHPFYHLKQQSGKSLLNALTHELEILKEQYNDILKREVIIDPILKRISEIQCTTKLAIHLFDKDIRKIVILSQKRGNKKIEADYMNKFYLLHKKENLFAIFDKLGTQYASIIYNTYILLLTPRRLASAYKKMLSSTEEIPTNISNGIAFLLSKEICSSLTAVSKDDLIKTIELLQNKKELIAHYKKSALVSVGIEEIYIPRTETIEKFFLLYKDTLVEQDRILCDSSLRGYISDDALREDYIQYCKNMVCSITFCRLYDKLKDYKILEMQELSSKLSKYLSEYSMPPLTLTCDALKPEKSKQY